MEPTPNMMSSIPFRYASDVIEGRIIVGQCIKQAVSRFYQWLKEAPDSGFSLDHDSGMRPIRFASMLINHTKGSFAGKPFDLAPFQQFTMYNVFGWKDESGNRRINTVYDKRAKKNGKSAEMAVLSLFMTSFDNEAEAEVYIGATKEEQAKICWAQARNFIESPLANPALKKLGFVCRQKEIEFLPNLSIIRPLGGDSKTQDGIGAHLAIIDEYHAHPTDAVKENLESSTVQRRQPIVWHITTAGTNIASVCKAYEDTCKSVLSGVLTDDHLWIMIHDMDSDDDWNDKTTWIKANPLLGRGLDLERIEKEYIKAVNQPSKSPNFKTKHLNMWVDAPEIWIPHEIWADNRILSLPIQKFEDYGSYIGLDLSTTTDLTAVVVVSNPDNSGNRYMLPMFFCPAATIERRSKEDRVPYRSWVESGYMIATPGDTVDYDVVEEYVSKIYFQYNCKRIEIDKWNAAATAQRLMEKGIEVSYFGQGIANISFPTKQFEKLIHDKKLLHAHNPVMDWMLSGCVIYRDANDNMKVHKGRSHKGPKRVDGIVAAIMAIGGSLTDSLPPVSKYESLDVEIYKKEQ